MSRTTRTSVPRTKAAAFAAAALSLSLFAPTAAIADEATDAPVTMDDTIEVEGGGFNGVDVLANDTDPNGDELAVCRLDVPDDLPIFAEIFDGQVFISSYENKTASFDITYYACDFDYLTPATLTINVTKIPEVKAKKLKKPGKVKFTNPGSKKVVVLYGDRREDQPDGQVGVAPMKSETVKVIRKKLFYIAFVRRTGSFAGQGFVKNIKLPKKGSDRPVSQSFGAKALKAWNTAQ